METPGIGECEVDGVVGVVEEVLEGEFHEGFSGGDFGGVLDALPLVVLGGFEDGLHAFLVDFGLGVCVWGVWLLGC